MAILNFSTFTAPEILKHSDDDSEGRYIYDRRVPYRAKSELEVKVCEKIKAIYAVARFEHAKVLGAQISARKEGYIENRNGSLKVTIDKVEVLFTNKRMNGEIICICNCAIDFPEDIEIATSEGIIQLNEFYLHEISKHHHYSPNINVTLERAKEILSVKV